MTRPGQTTRVALYLVLVVLAVVVAAVAVAFYLLILAGGHVAG